MKKILFIIIASTLFLGACTSTAPSSEAQSTTVQEVPKVETVEIIDDTPQQFEANMTGDYLLLDVRTPEEFDQGFIQGAVLIPVTELGQRLDEIEQYKDKPVLVYCRSGNRSVTASEILIDNGFTEVHNLLTGYNGWVTRGN